jgi:predicted nucleic acid-binding protein
MRRVLLDTNVILDVLLDREPFVADAAAIWQAVQEQAIQGYVTATTLTCIYYIAHKLKGSTVARVAVSEVLAMMRVCAVNDTVLRAALALSLADFEDAVQVACALAADLEAIVTRDVDGFGSSPVQSIAPADFVQRLGLRQASLDMS